MKKFVRILSLTLIAVMLCMTLASCGRISGEYTLGVDGFSTTYKFGLLGKVTVTNVIGDTTETIEGKYKIDGDKITFTYEKDGKEVTEDAKFEKTDDGIKMDGVEFKKK